MSITAEQILLAAEARVQAFTPAADGRAGMRFDIADGDELATLRRYLKRHGGHTSLRLLVLAEEDAAPVTVAPGPYEEQANLLRTCGFLATVPVAAALGTDEAFRDWVTRQPSIVSGEYSEYDDAGEGRCVPCHVRRSGEAGTAYKPPHACVPMTDDEHSRQHQGGETAVHVRWQKLRGIHPVVCSRQAGMDWFDAQVADIRARWSEERLCSALEVPALSHIQPLRLVEWARSHDVIELLPAEEVSA